MRSEYRAILTFVLAYTGIGFGGTAIHHYSGWPTTFAQVLGLVLALGGVICATIIGSGEWIWTFSAASIPVAGAVMCGAIAYESSRRVGYPPPLSIVAALGLAAATVNEIRLHPRIRQRKLREIVATAYRETAGLANLLVRPGDGSRELLRESHGGATGHLLVPEAVSSASEHPSEAECDGPARRNTRDIQQPDI